MYTHLLCVCLVAPTQNAISTLAHTRPLRLPSLRPCYGLNEARLEFLQGASDFSLFQNVQTGCWADIGGRRPGLEAEHVHLD